MVNAQTSATTIEAEVVITDNTNNSTATITVTVVITAPPPIAFASGYVIPAFNAGSAGDIFHTVPASAIEGGSGSYTFSISSATSVTINTNTGAIGFDSNYYLEGDIIVTLVANDDNTTSATAILTLTINNRLNTSASNIRVFDTLGTELSNTNYPAGVQLELYIGYNDTTCSGATGATSSLVSETTNRQNGSSGFNNARVQSQGSIYFFSGKCSLLMQSNNPTTTTAGDVHVFVVDYKANASTPRERVTITITS